MFALNFEIELDPKDWPTVARDQYVRATIRAFNRMGLYVEARAVTYATVSTGRLRGSIHSKPAEYSRSTGTVSVTVAADAAYSLYVELGFQGHFVPFHIAEDLYYQALRQWGWRVPSIDDIPANADPRKRWLVPRGRKRPVWGVNVSGKARPFLAPALQDLMSLKKYNEILEDEYNKILAPE